jgi:hypothetical protein
MAISVRITSKKKRGRLDARELVTRMATAARDYLSESLINGYRPADGAARDRKPDGKPMGFDTGELARGLRLVDAHKTRNRATVRIVGPESRNPFLAKHDDVITLNGIAADEMDRAVADYLEEIDP